VSALDRVLASAEAVVHRAFGDAARLGGVSTSVVISEHVEIVGDQSTGAEFVDTARFLPGVRGKPGQTLEVLADDGRVSARYLLDRPVGGRRDVDEWVILLRE
jgi:hypothetical protein